MEDNQFERKYFEFDKSQILSSSIEGGSLFPPEPPKEQKSCYCGQCMGGSRFDLKDFCDDLFEELKHGDQEHQDWLRNKITEFLIKTYNNRPYF